MLGALVYTIIEAPAHGWTSPQTLAGFGLALVALATGLAVWLKHRRWW